MEIDEKQEKCDMSDHNLITVTLKRKDKGTSASRVEKWKEYEYFKTDKDSLKKYRHEVEKRLPSKQRHNNYTKFELNTMGRSEQEP